MQFHCILVQDNPVPALPPLLWSSQPGMHRNVVWTATQAKITAALMKLDQVEREMAEMNDDKEGSFKHPMLSLQAF